MCLEISFSERNCGCSVLWDRLKGEYKELSPTWFLGYLLCSSSASEAAPTLNVQTRCVNEIPARCECLTLLDGRTAQHAQLTASWLVLLGRHRGRGLGNGWAAGAAEGRGGGTTCKEEFREAELALR